MTEQPTEELGWPRLPKTIALVALAGISGFLVWSFHNADWPAFIAALVIGSFSGFIAGRLVGVHLIPSLGAMAGFGGMFEGIFQGWTRYGWGGAVLGGPIGIVVGFVIVMLLLMLTHLVMTICGIDPFASPGSSGEKKDDSA